MPSRLFLFPWVEWLPFETKTTNRPLADMSPKAVLKATFGFDVIWTAKASGVALGVWAETEALDPPMSTNSKLAHSNQKNCFTKSSAKKTRIRAD